MDAANAFVEDFHGIAANIANEILVELAELDGKNSAIFRVANEI